MPISRPLLIALVAAVVAVFGFYATQSTRNSTDASAPVIPTAPSEPPAKTADAPAASKSGTSSKSSASGESPARKQPAARKRPAARAAGVPPPVARALDARKRIVLFFYKPGSADDRATARAVADLRGQRGLAVFTDPIGRLARYRGVIGELGISQAPAVVIVGKDRTARVIEGYVDPATLAQDVTDAR